MARRAGWLPTRDWMAVYIGHGGAPAVRPGAGRRIAIVAIAAIVARLRRDIDRAAAVIIVIIGATILRRGDRKSRTDDTGEGGRRCRTATTMPSPCTRRGLRRHDRGERQRGN